MFEKLLTTLEDKNLDLKTFFVVALFTILIGLYTSFTFNHPYVLITLVALGVSYPTIRHLMKFEKTLDGFGEKKSVFSLFVKEYFVYTTLFFAFTLGFFILFSLNLIDNLDVYSSFIPSIAGDFLSNDLFTGIFLNNLGVALLTFTISVIMFSGFLFVLSFNASILAAFLSSLVSDRFIILLFILPHLFFEIGGFILAGLAGNILMYGLEYGSKKSLLFKLSLKVLFVALLFVFIGALLETL